MSAHAAMAGRVAALERDAERLERHGPPPALGWDQREPNPGQSWGSYLSAQARAIHNWAAAMHTYWLRCGDAQRASVWAQQEKNCHRLVGQIMVPLAEWPEVREVLGALRDTLEEGHPETYARLLQAIDAQGPLPAAPGPRWQERFRA